MIRVLSRKLSKKLIFVIIGVAALLLIIFPFQKVEIGQIGLLYNSMTGKITGNIQPGWHYVIPFLQEFTVYPINDKSYVIARDLQNWNNGIDASITTPSQDNQTLSIDVTFLYYLDREKLEYIYQKFDGKDIQGIEKSYLDEVFKDSIIQTVSQYTAYDVYSLKRKEIQDEVKDILDQKLMGTGIMAKDVYINTVRLSEEMTSVIKAKALAEAAIIEAQGKSDANKLISDSLSEKIMQYESLNKLSESLKLVVVPSGSDTQLDFSSILNQLMQQTTDNSTNTDTSNK